LINDMEKYLLTLWGLVMGVAPLSAQRATSPVHAPRAVAAGTPARRSAAGMARSAGDAFYNVLDYGAVADSEHLCTPSIAAAIAAASRAGGGTVYFPAGHYLTGPVRLRSHLTLLLDAGAELDFSDRFEDYLPMVPSRWEGTSVHNFAPLLYAYGDSCIAITGRGAINGNGRRWWDFAMGKGDTSGRAHWAAIFTANNRGIVKPDDSAWMERGFLRPPCVQFLHCDNVLLQGVTFRNPPFWTINPEFCTNVTVTGVTIANPKSPNTDGINPESCRFVHISDCHIAAGDDCITIKSGKDRDGRNLAAPCEDITITNCTMLAGHGGVTIGSEMSGDVRRVVVSNCVFDGTDRGIRIKTARGRGGIVEDVRVDNVIMDHVNTQAIVLDMQYGGSRPEAVSERTPRFRRFTFSHITGSAQTAGLVNGLEEMPPDEVVLSDVRLETETGFVLRHAGDVAFHQVSIRTRRGPAIEADSVRQLELDGVTDPAPLPGVPVIRLGPVGRAWMHDCWAAEGTDIFLRSDTKVSLSGNELGNAKVMEGRP
jgi:polygalacturonase